ncbi:DEAD/DEAH box helicase family protein [Clostridium sp.]|uniref:DEAD/DEAH box helicase n=1 Tax=Clostridium sp. TaxID=1506 RepID=UPI002FCB3D7B
MDRTERQKLSIKRWIDSGGHSIVEGCTGFGKTRIAIMLIQALYKRNSMLRVLVVVPTEVLKDQWNRELAKNQLFTISKVEIINTVIKNIYNVDLLILDEIHQFCSPQNIELFKVITYKYVLGLTATLERLDGRHKLLTSYLTVCDTITLEEALENR